MFVCMYVNKHIYMCVRSLVVISFVNYNRKFKILITLPTYNYINIYSCMYVCKYIIIYIIYIYMCVLACCYMFGQLYLKMQLSLNILEVYK